MPERAPPSLDVLATAPPRTRTPGPFPVALLTRVPGGARVPPGLRTPADVLAMQRTAGNGAVMRRLARNGGAAGESVQRAEGTTLEPSDEAIRAAAAAGLQTLGGPMPHLG